MSIICSQIKDMENVYDITNQSIDINKILDLINILWSQ